MAPWDATAIKAHARLTSQRLGQLQAKFDADASITRKDIATLLQQGNVYLARAKAHKLISEDALGDLMEVLEMEIAQLVDHWTELESSPEPLQPTPILAEAVSSIIYTAPQIPCRELHVLRDVLAQRFGPDFTRSAARNRDQHVSRRIVNISTMPSPSASVLNAYLASIARTYGVNWFPDPQRYDVVNPLSEILNPQVPKEIDVALLRQYCSYGIADDPSWFRPRIWKLFLGLLPAKQDAWDKDIRKQRECYYDLVRRLLEPYNALSEPVEPLCGSDEALLNIVHHLTRIPREMFSHLEGAPEDLPQSPLSPSAAEDIKIPQTFALDSRLKKLKRHGSTGLHTTVSEETPIISVTTAESENDTSDEGDEDEDPELKSKSSSSTSPAYSFGDAHPLHCSAMLRLLFIHAAINPGQLSPHIPALLIPLYTVLHSEVEPEDLAHVEADTFWLFEAMVAEFSELDEGEGSQRWLDKLDQTLAWADPELYENLLAKGLQPSLPHYSYRWLATILSYTIPAPSIFLFWDALFSRPPRERENNPKLNFLVDLACSMLLTVRKDLLSVGHTSKAKAGNQLWGGEDAELLAGPGKAPSDGDAFLEGITLLQAYPRRSIEDAERIIQTANDLVKRRELDTHKTATHGRSSSTSTSTQPTGLVSRLGTTMWKGFTNQVDSGGESSPESSGETDVAKKRRDDGNETEKPALSGASAAGSVPSATGSSWWGKVAAVAPKVIVSPAAATDSSADHLPPLPPPPSAIDDEAGYSSTTSRTSAGSGIWNYAQKLRDSDTAAVVAKVGTNWRARAMSVGQTWGQGADSSKSALALAPAGTGAPQNGQYPLTLSHMSGSSDYNLASSGDRGQYSSLKIHLRPHGSPIQRSPSYSPTSSHRSSYSTSSSLSPLSAVGEHSFHDDEESFVNKTKAALMALKNLSPSSTPSKTAPRPLLLNSASPITSPPMYREPASASSEWADVIKANNRHLNRKSTARSSISSLSPSEALRSSRSDQWDSDSGPPRGSQSRFVPLNRRSVSPMAPPYRLRQQRAMASPPGETFAPSALSTHVSPASSGDFRPRPRLVAVASAPPIQSTYMSTSPEDRMSMGRRSSTASTSTISSSAVASEGPRKGLQITTARRDSTTSLTNDMTSDTQSPIGGLSRHSRVRSRRKQGPAHLSLKTRSPVETAISSTPTPTSSSMAVSAGHSGANLTVAWPGDDASDVAATPRATTFVDTSDTDDVTLQKSSSASRPRRRRSNDTRDRSPNPHQHLGESAGQEPRARKTSTGAARRRKVSNDKDAKRHVRGESRADEGDDEGYDDLLSAYESEDFGQEGQSYAR